MSERCLEKERLRQAKWLEIEHLIEEDMLKRDVSCRIFVET